MGRPLATSICVLMIVAGAIWGSWAQVLTGAICLALLWGDKASRFLDS